MDEPQPPSLSIGQLFWRFLRFGLLAWGGPVAQIAMIRQELVEQERWISRQRFNRVLAVYQALPGPEAHELCVYFGMIAGGRLGGLAAGLGFMLPGFALMLGLSWFYVTYGIGFVWFGALLTGFQPAVAALIVRAVHRLSQHILHNRYLWLITLIAGVLTYLKLSFIMVLLVAGGLYSGMRWSTNRVTSVAPWLVLGIVGLPSLGGLFWAGLRTGLLTFGGAYTAIPFLQRDAVEIGGWMTQAQFLDGIALSGILPAPLIIFSTFVGYLGGGLWGAIALTAGVFVPAFSFTLLGHTVLERLIDNQATHDFLDGITAGVIGLIAVGSAPLVWQALHSQTQFDWFRIVIFGLSLIVLYRWKSTWSTPITILGAGLLGLITLLI